MTPAERMVEGIRRRISSGPQFWQGSVNIRVRHNSSGDRYYAGGGKGYLTLEEALLSLCDGLDAEAVSEAGSQAVDSLAARLRVAEMAFEKQRKRRMECEAIVEELALTKLEVADAWGRGVLVRKARKLIDSGAESR